jgi:hypothetical protein
MKVHTNNMLKSRNNFMGLNFFKSKRNYEDFKEQIPISVQPLFDSIRGYCLSLGENVVEDIRMHRVVFGKSISFRWFADVEPSENYILLKIQRDRKEEPKIHKVEISQDLTFIKKIITDAFISIR